MINLQKGQRVDLTKTNPTVKKFGVGLGWGENPNFDLDASAFILGANEKVLSENHVVFYNNKVSPNAVIQHSGDNRTGAGDGDDETLTFDVSKVTNETKIVFVVTIHEAAQKNQNFGQVNDAFIRIFDVDSKQEIMRYDLSEDFSVETAMAFGELYLKDGEWKFQAVGTGMKGGLNDYCVKYGAA